MKDDNRTREISTAVASATTGEDRTEIRCCCDCGLIGTVPSQNFEFGQHYNLAGLDFEYTTYAREKIVRVLPVKNDPLLALFGIDLAILADVDVEFRPALKSKDYDLEAVRKIPGFIEAPPKDLEVNLEEPVTTN